MDNSFYIVLEIQQSAEGARSVIPYAFDALNPALAKYFTVCAAAIDSGLPYHGVVVMGDDAIVLEQRVFDRREEKEETEGDEA